jgi:hypothetical protein
MHKAFWISVLSLVFACCAAQRIERSMDPYIGRPVSDLAIKIGPPTTQFKGASGLVF